MEDDTLEEEDLKPLSVLLGGMDNDELEQFVRSVSLQGAWIREPEGADF
jgi:hypothetical protein